MEEESWGRNHGGGIWEASGRHLGGIWRQLGGIWEESEMHLEASGRHLKGTSGGSMGPGGILEPERQLGGKVFTVFEVARDRFACILEPRPSR